MEALPGFSLPSFSFFLLSSQIDLNVDSFFFRKKKEVGFDPISLSSRPVGRD